MTNTQLTYLRTIATVIVTGLAAVVPEYPTYTWIPAIIAVFATVGIHAIPSVGQSTKTAITPEVKVMSEQPTAAQLMGIAPITAPKTDEVPAVAEAPSVSEVPAAPKTEEVPAAPEQPATVVAPEATPVLVADASAAQKTDATLTDTVVAAQPVLTDDEIATLRKILDKLS